MQYFYCASLARCDTLEQRHEEVSMPRRKINAGRVRIWPTVLPSTERLIRALESHLGLEQGQVVDRAIQELAERHHIEDTADAPAPDDALAA
jgi:hypothetical protein